MEKWLEAEGPHLGTIAPTAAVMSRLPLKRLSIDMTVTVMNYVEAKHCRAWLGVWLQNRPMCVPPLLPSR